MFGIRVTLAHNPNEISYFFKLGEKELVIHLTPKSAIGILEKLHPNLKNQNSFLLKAYVSDFEEYFNRNVLFFLDDQAISLHLIATRLNAHNATITFALNNVPSLPKNFKIEVASFTDIYIKAKNHVFVYSDATKKHYLLDAQKKTISGDIHNTTQRNDNSKFWVLTVSALFTLVPIGFTVYQKQRILLKPFRAA